MSQQYDKCTKSLMSIEDMLLKRWGSLSRFMMAFTIIRLIVALLLLPLYMMRVILRSVPCIFINTFRFMIVAGCRLFINDTEKYRAQEQLQAQSQFNNRYVFPEDVVLRLHPNGKGSLSDMPFANNIEEISVCGATARFIHIKPENNGVHGEYERKGPIVLLHGNPSWSYIWRNVLLKLVEQGHEVFALDWIGHGRSDKITRQTCISFELHMRTLIELFESTGLEDATLVAHDWGGCIALCTLPHLRANACRGLFLLNAFLPPRPSDMSLHYGLLYAIWFMSTGIMDGYLPESGVMRFMSPHLPQKEIEGYEAPYRDFPLNSKAGVFRFAHIAPGMPEFVLRSLRETWLWKLGEGLCGPIHFSSLNAQTSLSARGDEVRQFWRNGDMKARRSAGSEAPFRVVVVFGEDDPLLKDYKHILTQTINADLMVDWAPSGIWLSNAGHYPVEERPGDIADLIVKFSSS
ncbi:hypothetical protein DTO271D3_4144 [Paecilomyces variotii]|nr:hypothetical protein DTO169E5_399 [Paecilomyces variotii]KAJ9315571.1 hypothetical protein DTO271D3_4144 [Paecilomyces variotii]